MTDINNAQTAVAAYCEGDIALGDRLVESAAAAQQGLERQDGTVLSGEQTVALLRARAISDALDVVDGRLESRQGPADMVERISGVRDRLMVEHEPAYQTDKRLFLADTPPEESLGPVRDRGEGSHGPVAPGDPGGDRRGGPDRLFPRPRRARGGQDRSAGTLCDATVDAADERSDGLPGRRVCGRRSNLSAMRSPKR